MTDEIDQDVREAIMDGLKSFCKATPDISLSAAMRSAAADFILADPRMYADRSEGGMRDRETLLIRLETIQRTIDSWVKWDKDGRDREGLETPGDTYIMQVPVWPTHRQFGVWSETLQSAITVLSEKPA